MTFAVAKLTPLDHALLSQRIQCGGGFVQDQDLGIGEEGSGDGHALAFARRDGEPERENTVTECPQAARRPAAAAPVGPPPMMATSNRASGSNPGSLLPVAAQLCPKDSAKLAALNSPAEFFSVR